MKGLSVLTAVVVVLLMVHAGGVSAEGVLPLVSCEPNCTFAADGDQVPDPLNCTTFYYCYNGDAYGPAWCGYGSVFDSVIGLCTDGDPDTCEPICGPSGGGCPLTCNDTLTSIGDAFDCSTYYFCTTSEAVPETCPANRPYFDGSTHTCVNDESVCCSGYCVPYCDGTGLAMVPDPKDCTRFYLCGSEEGVPGRDSHFFCDEGSYFDVQLGRCVSGTPPDPCPTLCDAARGAETWSNFLNMTQERDWD